MYHCDIFGKREVKYDILSQNSLTSLSFTELNYQAPNYFFIPKDFSLKSEYEKFFKVDELFLEFSNGIETGKDRFFYATSEKELMENIKNSFSNREVAIKNFEITDTTSFRFLTNFNNAIFSKKHIKIVSYRPFDAQYCYYDNQLQRRPAFKIMQNMFEENVSLLVPRQFSGNFTYAFVSKNPTDCNLTGTAKKFGSSPIFPLYLYSQTIGENNESQLEKSANFNPEILNKLENSLKLSFVLENGKENEFTALQVLDYIYAVLHSPNYRETYKEFLKIDFPRIPYPKNSDEFFNLATLGSELRALHLMTAKVLDTPMTEYPVVGDNVVGKIKFAPDNKTTGKVYINDSQYFDKVPATAWEFFIGGYQPAQKWLKDRKDGVLTRHDIRHYGRIIVALNETANIMQKIDEVFVLAK